MSDPCSAKVKLKRIRLETRAAGDMNSPADLHAAVKEGAVQRIRPKIMTVCAILFGLLPIMWSPTTQAGADVMKRIAALCAVACPELVEWV
jgi:Cu/Ag efflux pump CusA